VYTKREELKISKRTSYPIELVKGVVQSKENEVEAISL